MTAISPAPVSAMNPLVELNLALILFLPWFTILAVLFWKFPRAPRGLARTLFDSASLLLAVAAAAGGMYWSMANADPTFGHMWQQVLATSVAYGLFLLVVAVALVVRWRWLRDREASSSSSTAAAAAAGSSS
jgi:membrane protein implicated in regulation of membrane protease activity